MKDSMIFLLGSMFTIQRWNFLPRIETWVEAENAAYVTHVSYVIGRSVGMNPDQLESMLLRALLKSLNKHYMTDISLSVRDKLKAKSPEAWMKLVDSTAIRTSKLFPRVISDNVRKYCNRSRATIVSNLSLDSSRIFSH